MQCFSKNLFFFVEKYERNRAEKYFEMQDEYLPGYEQDRISVNEHIQQLAYKKLKKEFLEDSLIQSLRKTEKR